MPIPLPSGLLPTPVYFEPFEVLTGPRVTRFRFDLMDREENLLGTIDSVQNGGSVEWQAYASVKGGGTMTVRDIGQEIDWLNIRIRPVIIVQSVGTEEADETPLGVFLAAAPVEKWDDLGRTWDVEIADKCSILDTDVPNGPGGEPASYTAPVGSNVLDLVMALITDAGERVDAIEPDDKTLTSSLVWDLGTTRLQIINDMLSAAGFGSLWCDGQGQYRVTPYLDPIDRTPVYAALNPFSKGDGSMMSPDWTRDRDIYEVPNRYFAIAQGDGEEEAMTSTVTNEDPTSPFSFQARGRWITRVMDGVEAVSQADLDARARQGLSQSSSISSGITASHLFLPDLLVNETVQFTNPDAEIDFRTIVTRVNVPFDPVALCSSDLREVLAT